MMIPRWMLEAVAITAIASCVLTLKWCLLATLTFLIVRGLFTDFGQRCWRTLPRDLTRHPTKECVVEVETGRRMNFHELNTHANKYANFIKSRGYQKEDVIALFLENGVEFFAGWLGCSKLGVVSAWINTNLKLETLAHSIKVSKCKAVITSSKLWPQLNDAISQGLLDANGIAIFVVGSQDGSDQAESLDDKLVDGSEPPLVDGVTFHSILCYIYTSGTTGNPKAAIIRHYRYFLMASASGLAFDITGADRLYITLPMYHSAGGIIGLGNVVVNGTTAVIRTKFSASNFWKDCIRFNCTASQYIGEICRYLLAQKPSLEAKAHNVRVMYGNGLRPQIWGEFVRRFGIRRIGELYGSTEGNSNILNLDNHEGACGFMPIYPFLKNIYPVRLVKVDKETGELIRDPRTGLCVSCKPGDTGEMVGMIRATDPMLRFEGYVNTSETSKKILRNVMEPGDQVFSSGDILYWDKLGYLYFKDRRGDTFRWKGENCATTEIEGVVQPIRSIIDATVFGVEVPHYEGRAGMIAVSLAEDTNVEFLIELAKRLSDNLATYAIPVFLRICQYVDRTGTFKLKKAVLQKAAFDPSKCEGDPIFYWNASEKAYQHMNEKMFADINSVPLATPNAYTREESQA